MPLYKLVKAMTFAAVVLFATAAAASIVTVWNEAALQEVRLSKPLRNGPPMVARALAIVHTCMYDAWAAYDDVAVGTTDINGTRRRPAEERTDDHRKKALSFAAYRCLRNLYPDGSLPVPLEQPSVRLNAMLVNLGYSLDETCDTDEDCRNDSPETAAGLGNLAAQAVIDARRHDGSNQYGDLPPAPCPVLTPMQWPLPCAAAAYGQTSAHPTPARGEVWAYADYDLGPEVYSPYVPANPLMGFCTPRLAVCQENPLRSGPLALLALEDACTPVLVPCPAPDPFILPSLPWPNVADPNHWQPLVYNTHGRQTFVGAHWGRVTPFALTSADQFDSRLFVPPPDFMRNNGQYLKNVRQMIEFSSDLDDTRKFIVEYWADGPDSECPPGHWALFAQYVSRRDQHSIDKDVKMFFAMHNASFDASIVAWHIKRKYDGVRPITAIRYTKQGKTIWAWGGPGRPTENIPGEQWMPYNPGNNLTPPFPGYFSGHSVFSRSSATVLKLFTGSDNFVRPGDPDIQVIKRCDVSYFGIDFTLCFGRVEPGIPAVDTPVSFATFSDAADQAGLSRLYGGIHFPDDNTIAQEIGELIGQQAWAKAQRYFNGAP